MNKKIVLVGITISVLGCLCFLSILNSPTRFKNLEDRQVLFAHDWRGSYPNINKTIHLYKNTIIEIIFWYELGETTFFIKNEAGDIVIRGDEIEYHVVKGYNREVRGSIWIVPNTGDYTIFIYAGGTGYLTMIEENTLLNQSTINGLCFISGIILGIGLTIFVLGILHRGKK